MFIFGYGSLIWKADFPFIERTQGFIRGYRRRFWQGSHDHRGTSSSPGRVLTLIPETVYSEKFRHLDELSSSVDRDEQVWGIVYRIADDEVDSVKDHLDFREKNGYSIDYVNVYVPSSAGDQILENVMVYVANHDNEAFLGPAHSIHSLASHIMHSRGPSGLNSQYFYELFKYMELNFPSGALDRHLVELKVAMDRLVSDADFNKVDNHYSLLGLEYSALEKEIKKAYHAKALQYHPDKNTGASVTNDQFLRITEAFNVLIDPDKRKLYNLELRKSRINSNAVMVDQHVSLEDFDETSDGNFQLACRCGGYYNMNAADEIRLLSEDADSLIISCTNCSLTVRVLRDTEICLNNDDD